MTRRADYQPSVDFLNLTIVDIQQLWLRSELDDCGPRRPMTNQASWQNSSASSGRRTPSPDLAQS